MFQGSGYNIFLYTVNPFYNHTFGDHFFCDTNELCLNEYSHIPYKSLQVCDYKSKKITNQPFHAIIKVSID
jgi:hypothetical protein